MRTLDNAGIPVVLLDRVIGKRSSRYGVFVDNQLGARQAVLHLLEREGRSLVYINGPAHLSQSVERRSGVEAALRESGVDRRESADFGGRTSRSKAADD